MNRMFQIQSLNHFSKREIDKRSLNLKKNKNDWTQTFQGKTI